MTKQSNTLALIGIFIIIGLIYFIDKGTFLKPTRDLKPNNQSSQSLENINWQFPVMKEIVSATETFHDVEMTKATSIDGLLWKKDNYSVYLPTTDSITLRYHGVVQGVTNTKGIYSATPLGEIDDKIVKVFENEGFLKHL